MIDLAKTLRVTLGFSQIFEAAGMPHLCVTVCVFARLHLKRGVINSRVFRCGYLFGSHHRRQVRLEGAAAISNGVSVSDRWNFLIWKMRI